jgi:hypothetical protein
MKSIRILSAGIFFMTLAFAGQSQSVTNSKPLLIHTLYLNINSESRNINTDSVMQIYRKHILEPNQFYTNVKIVSHWYGHDSREVLAILELKNWDDIPKAEARQDEIIAQLIKDKNMEGAGKMWELLTFPEHHSDEIYRVVAE